jgi:LPS export ABC transporter protein LptC
MKPQRYVFKYTKILYPSTFIAALLCGAAMLFSGCVNDLETIKAFSSNDDLPVVHSYNYETTFTDSGVVRFHLKTTELKRFEGDGQPFTEFPQGLELWKYDNRSQIISRITSNYAKEFVKERRWEAKNNVVAVNAVGDTLKTEHLIWDERAEKIFSDQYVKIIRPDQIITGIGFESDQNLENWRIKNPRGTIYVQVNVDNSEEIGPDSNGPPGMRPMEILP